ncbi:hypothetical protein [Azospirillum sp. HJ39]|uniref:hypothetical protein n=1 Tax=Azospirillum sp. HJ39 TaxID=3159496 RepID=UPI003556AFDC
MVMNEGRARLEGRAGGSTTSSGVIGTAGLPFLRGTDPFTATAMTVLRMVSSLNRTLLRGGVEQSGLRNGARRHAVRIVPGYGCNRTPQRCPPMDDSHRYRPDVLDEVKIVGRRDSSMSGTYKIER